MKATSIMTLALGGLVAVTALVSCKDEKAAAAAAAAQQMHPVPVSVMPFVQQDVDIYSTWFGHLRGVQQADIRPEVSGKLLSQEYADGAPVQKGDVLFRIDPSTYQAAVDQCSAAVAVAKAAAMQASAARDRAKQDVERYSVLVKSGSVAEKMYTDAFQILKETEAGLAAAEAQVKQAEAALENAQLNLDRCTIRAPFTGLASKATVSVGDLIAVGSPAPLTSMSSIDPIRVDFTVPAKQLLGKNLAEEKPFGDFELIQEDGSVFESKGTVVAVDSEVSKSTGTVSCIGHVPNAKLNLRSGSAVRVRAKIDTVKNALLVPSRALISSMAHRYVFLVNPADNTPICVDVQLGQEVTIPVKNGDGNMVPMLMQVVRGTVKPIEETLRDYGISSPEEAQVVVEGGQMADRYAKVNFMMKAKGAQGGFGTLVPTPFVYTAPVSTTASVTAKQN
ncbi:MAG: efflux RND transporter periplasmic adaptor subunit [Akkermansia sp.]|nr:efflux RND transporter periplasmic adaptor subunit [Akkermansia sp.]